jgi:hypothetical protein
MILIMLIKVRLNEVQCRVHTSIHLRVNCPIQNGLKHGGSLSLLLFNFALECTNRKVQENHMELKLNGAYQLVAYADRVNLLGHNIDTIQKNLGIVFFASNEAGLEINVGKYILLSPYQNAV